MSELRDFFLNEPVYNSTTYESEWYEVSSIGRIAYSAYSLGSNFSMYVEYSVDRNYDVIYTDTKNVIAGNMGTIFSDVVCRYVRLRIDSFTSGQDLKAQAFISTGPIGATGAGGTTTLTAINNDVQIVGVTGGYTIDIGSSASGLNVIKITDGLGDNLNGDYAVAIGYQAGETNQGSRAVAIGCQAGRFTQSSLSVAIGNEAGQANQGIYAVGIGDAAGKDVQGDEAIAIGRYTGRTNQGQFATAIGPTCGITNQGVNSVAVGRWSGESAQGTNSVAVGPAAGQNSQGTFSTSIGYYSGKDTQGTEAVAVGASAGQTNQGNYAIAIGSGCASLNQAQDSIALGRGCVAPTTNGMLAFGNNMVAPVGITGTSIQAPIGLIRLEWNGTEYRVPVLPNNATDLKLSMNHIMPVGEIAYQDHITPTTINVLAINTPYLINVATTLTTNSSSMGMPFFDMPSNGRLRYIGTITQKFHLALSIDVASAGGANKLWTFSIYKNGVFFPRSRYELENPGTNEFTMACHIVIELVTNDYVECWFENNSDTNDLIVHNHNIVCMGTIGS